MANNFIQGIYTPKFPEKYKGDPTNIVYRSRWESVVMRWCDLTQSVLEWSSEELIVPYFDGSTGKQRRYFPDFIIKVRTASGSVDTIMVEVKPKSQAIPPNPPKKMTAKTKQRYLTEMDTYVKNQCKWEAAEEYCKKRGWKFMVMTEDHIFGPKSGRSK